MGTETRRAPTRVEQTQTCEIRDLLDRLADKWSLLVVELLGEGTRRFTELRREIDGVSQRMLTLTLRNLERDGLVIRTVYPEIPPRVEYQLTELGRTLTNPLDELWNWAAQHMHSVNEARTNYDRIHNAAEAPQPETRRYAGAAN